MHKHLLRSLVLLITATLVLTMPRTALADIIIGSCTIVSNPTATHFTNCPNANLNTADLSGGINLSFANFSGANLSNADMSDSIGSDINLIGANLQSVDLSGATLLRANLNSANLTGTDLSLANLSAASLTGVVWSGTLCPDAVDSSTAGNTCIGHLLLPSIAATANQASGPSYSAGTWANQNVTVHFACSTAVAGRTIATCTANQSYTTDGSFTAQGQATDNAGFFRDASFGPILIDKTAPAVSASAARADNTPYTAGTWTDQDVTVSFTCAENPGGSGLATNSVAGATLTSEGANQAVTNTGACVDKAGNAAAKATFGQINIDKSAPETTITAQPDDPSPLLATFIFSGTDALSGLGGFACSLNGAPFTACSSPQQYGSLPEGQNTFQVRAIDALGHVDATPASYAWNTRGDLPVAVDQALATAEDTPLPITLAASSSHALTYAIVDQPDHGTLGGTPPAMTYTPTADFNGADSFTFRANDGQFNSNLAIVSIKVTPVNDAPVAASLAITTLLNTPVTLNLGGAGTDVDGDALVYTVAESPAHGTVSGTGPNLLYTPADKFLGRDHLTIQVSDGQAPSNVADVTIEVISPPFTDFLPLIRP